MSGFYDPKQREREKQEARDEDERLLRDGLISPEELGKRNGLFSGLDFSKARIERPRRLR